MAYGDKKKFLVALVTLEPEAIAEWAANNDLGSASPEELAAAPQVHELIRGEIETRNRELASFETVKKFHILPQDLTIESGEMTPSMKIKRNVVVERYGKHLEALYQE